MPAARRAYAFEGQEYQQVRAHGARSPIRTCRVAEGVEAGACNFIDLTILPPGTDIGLHTHAEDNEEIYVVVAGQGWMTLDGERFAVGPGDVLVNRPAGSHGLSNPGPGELRLVVLEVPVVPRGVGAAP
jgi:mannose-6-phosphate isomerase-like protein (cupin superfamily)